MLTSLNFNKKMTVNSKSNKITIYGNTKKDYPVNCKYRMNQYEQIKQGNINPNTPFSIKDILNINQET